MAQEEQVKTSNGQPACARLRRGRRSTFNVELSAEGTAANIDCSIGGKRRDEWIRKNYR
jgi:hypothetical protein